MTTHGSWKRGVSRRFAAIVLALTFAAAGCENPLNVENPNNLIEEDLEQPSGVGAAVNGALATTSEGFGQMQPIYASVAGEMFNVGSRDAWLELENGLIANPNNEFTDAAFPFVGEGRFMVDKAIELAERFDAEGTLPNRLDLARAYFFGALMYTQIGDFMDNFVLPTDPMEPAAPVGEDNMDVFYQTALQRLDQALQVMDAEGVGASADLRVATLATKARTHFMLEVWNKLNPKGQTPADPLVQSAEAVAAAEDALSRVGNGTDWSYDHRYSPSTISFEAGEWKQTGYINTSDTYTELDPPTVVVGIALQDPIDAVDSPPVADFVGRFEATPRFAPVPAVSAQEMHLIIAEDALARGDNATFTEHINHIRSVWDLSPYSGQMSAEEMLLYTRRSELYMQGRWLHDLYRFGLQSPYWSASSTAATVPGSFAPITITECRANTQTSSLCGL